MNKKGGVMEKFNHYLVICVLLFVILSGCATVKDIPKGFAGISTRILEDKRKEAITKQFNYDSDICYRKIKEVLSELGTYIYAQDKRKKMIAIYLSESDTTPVGIFLTEIGEKLTHVEVSSPSTYAKEYIAPRLFVGLAENYVK